MPEKKVYLVHGFEATPNGGWRSWVMNELRGKDIYACALPMPSPADPVCEEWVAEISRVVARGDGDAIFLVGHSLGVPAILRFLESAPEGTRIAGAVLVSGPSRTIGKSKIEHFLEKPFDYARIRSRCGTFSVIHGDNDDRVPFSHAEELSRELGADLVVVPNGGHLNGSSGFRTLPECMAALGKMMA